MKTQLISIAKSITAFILLIFCAVVIDARAEESKTLNFNLIWEKADIDPIRFKSCLFSTNDKYLVVYNGDSMQVLDARNGNYVTSFKCKTSGLPLNLSFKFINDDKILCHRSDDYKTVEFYDFPSMKKVFELGVEGGTIPNFDVSPDNKYLLAEVAYELDEFPKHRLVIWDIESKKIVAEKKMPLYDGKNEEDEVSDDFIKEMSQIHKGSGGYKGPSFFKIGDKLHILCYAVEGGKAFSGWEIPMIARYLTTFDFDFNEKSKEFYDKKILGNYPNPGGGQKPGVAKKFYNVSNDLSKLVYSRLEYYSFHPVIYDITFGLKDFATGKKVERVFQELSPELSFQLLLDNRIAVLELIDNGELVFADFNVPDWDTNSIIIARGEEIASGKHFSKGAVGCSRDGKKFAVLCNEGLCLFGVEMKSVVDNNDNNKAKGSQLVYSNPIQSDGKIEMHLDAPTKLTLELYDELGKSLYTLADGIFEKGVHIVHIPVEKLAEGLYFIRFNENSNITFHKILIKK